MSDSASLKVRPPGPAIHNVTVFCSSSPSVHPIYRDAATELGTEIVRRGWGLVYGGTRAGMMGVLANAVRAGGGKVIGITPQLFVDKGIADQAADELIVSTSFRDRKMLLEERGDALVALPGGLGTLEELFEAIVGKQLGYHAKPIVLVNIAAFFEPLLKLIDHGIELQFIPARARQLMFVAPTVAAAVEFLGQPNRV
jgi:uncharacterized protein (TIGR00730 family)